MEYVKCSACGKETPAALTRCRHCGERIVKAQSYVTPKPLKGRNNFITFWLLMGATISFLVSIFTFIHIFSSTGLFLPTPEPLWIKISLFLFCIAHVVGYAMLLCWLKQGFYLLLGLGILEAIPCLYSAIYIPIILYILLPLIILYLVLRSSKNGESYWNLMGYRIPNSDEIVQSNRNWFVSFWLYEGAIWNVLSLMVSILVLLDMINIDFDLPMHMKLFALTYSILCLTGYVLLINGYRFGFYLVAGLIAIAQINLWVQYDVNLIWSLPSIIIGIGILFAILQIPKNGISYWKLLS